MKIPHLKLGATGRFPYGKADETDEGELRLAMATDHVQGIIRIHFGKPVVWVGLTEAIARAFAEQLIEKADELKAKRS